MPALYFATARMPGTAASSANEAAGQAWRILSATRPAHAGTVSVLSQAIEIAGRLDILVNNAGLYQYAPLHDITTASFRDHFDLNLLGPLLMMREAARVMGEDGGSIINIGSVAMRALIPSTAIYAGSKAALGAFTTVFAKELAPRGIRVNIIHPGPVDTEGARNGGLMGGDWEKQLVAMTPLGRFGQVADVTPAALFLALGDARWITGEVLYVTGGL